MRVTGLVGVIGVPAPSDSTAVARARLHCGGDTCELAGWQSIQSWAPHRPVTGNDRQQSTPRRIRKTTCVNLSPLKLVGFCPRGDVRKS